MSWTEHYNGWGITNERAAREITAPWALLHIYLNKKIIKQMARAMARIKNQATASDMNSAGAIIYTTESTITIHTRT